ncbi:MAG TPA: VOC family protein [Candidatus Saccharimonadales bacterium]
MRTNKKGIFMETEMKLGYAIVYVNDVAATLAFYERAFGLKQKSIDDNSEYGELDTGATRLGFSQAEFADSLTGVKHYRNTATNNPGGFELALITPDVAKAVQTAKDAGAVVIAEPQEKPWGQTVAYLRDINGVLIELATPLE